MKYNISKEEVENALESIFEAMQSHAHTGAEATSKENELAENFAEMAEFRKNYGDRIIKLIEQDIENKGWVLKIITGMLGFWMLCVLIIVAFTMESDAVKITLLGTSTANFVGLMATIVTYYFRRDQYRWPV